MVPRKFSGAKTLRRYICTVTKSPTPMLPSEIDCTVKHRPPANTSTDSSRPRKRGSDLTRILGSLSAHANSIHTSPVERQSLPCRQTDDEEAGGIRDARRLGWQDGVERRGEETYKVYVHVTGKQREGRRDQDTHQSEGSAVYGGLRFRTALRRARGARRK